MTKFWIFGHSKAIKLIFCLYWIDQKLRIENYLFSFVLFLFLFRFFVSIFFSNEIFNRNLEISVRYRNSFIQTYLSIHTLYIEIGLIVYIAHFVFPFCLIRIKIQYSNPYEIQLKQSLSKIFYKITLGAIWHGLSWFHSVDSIHVSVTGIRWHWWWQLLR